MIAAATPSREAPIRIGATRWWYLRRRTGASRRTPQAIVGSVDMSVVCATLCGSAMDRKMSEEFPCSGLGPPAW